MCAVWEKNTKNEKKKCVVCVCVFFFLGENRCVFYT